MDGFNTEAFTLLGVAITVIGLRTTARWIMVGPKGFQADDYLMLVACVSGNGTLGFFALSLLINMGIGGVWARNRRCVHGRRMVHGPCQ